MPRSKTDLIAYHDEIVELAGQGLPLSVVAERLGLVEGSVRYYVRKHEIPHQKNARRREMEERSSACRNHHETVVAMAEAGATMKMIAEAVGTTNQNRVREYLTRHGIQRPVWREPPSDHPMARATTGPLNSSWKGGRNLDMDGYVLLWMPGHPEASKAGYVREHRIVMAQTIGRPLLPGEVVDHRNDIRDDNRPENLRLFSSNGEHLSVTLTGRKSRASRGLPPSSRKSSRKDDQT